MKTLLWLDDIRDPFKDNWLTFSPIGTDCLVIWVKCYQEFIEHIKDLGLPDGICFDHDLADEHYTPEKYWNDYEESKKYQESKNYTEKTGYDCAKWLIDYCIDNNCDLPKWNIQSANPVGKDNIKGLLENYEKFKLGGVQENPQ